MHTFTLQETFFDLDNDVRKEFQPLELSYFNEFCKKCTRMSESMRQFIYISVYLFDIVKTYG